LESSDKIQITGFPPISGYEPEVLILGTMPGVASLMAQEYYAFQGNAFWKILSAIKGIKCPENYDEKKQLIIDIRIALWDVCYSCIRPGSADNDIHDEKPNQIFELLTENPTINSIFFNGQTAEKLFNRHFKKIEGIKTVTLPSTSPANTMSFIKKLEAWRIIVD
jgi:hypoxanthine-DNA glycosylase